MFGDDIKRMVDVIQGKLSEGFKIGVFMVQGPAL